MASHALNKPSNLMSDATPTWIGIGLLLLSALGFSISILIANMAFQDGVNTQTANAVRHFVTIFLLFFAQKIRGRQLSLPKRERYNSLLLGISIFVIGIGYLGATQYIPVSLAVLIFYTSPFFVVIISRFTENQPITSIRLIAIIIAFGGLALALKIQSITTLDRQGVAFAFLASFGYTILVISSSLIMRRADPQAVNFHCLASGTVLFVAFMLCTGGPGSLITLSGWIKLGGSSLALSVGYVSFFSGLEIVGPVKTSMLMNAEPVLTIVLAAILLGERLSSIQLIGAACVILGIVLITTGFGSIRDRKNPF